MASITVQERTTILKLVAGMFNAAPGATLLNGFTDAFVAMNKDYAALATALSESDAFKSLYPSFLTAEEFANKFLDTLGLKADTNAQDWVKAKVNAGESFGSVIFQALVAIEASTDEQFKAARDQLANKAAVAEYYSVTLGKSADSLEALQGVVANVSDDAASAQAAKDALDPVQTFTLTTGRDSLIGTGAADTFTADFNGNANTLESGDVVKGGEGTDTLKAFLGDASNFAINASTDSVENIVIRAQSLDRNGANGENNIYTDQVTVDADRMQGVNRWENNSSRADLVVEDVRIKDSQITKDITIAMVDTDPGHVDFGLYFDQQSLRAGASTTASQMVFKLRDGLASNDQPLGNLSVDGVKFTLGDKTVTLRSTAIDNAKTYADLVTAINAAVASNADAKGITASVGTAFTEVNGVPATGNFVVLTDAQGRAFSEQVTFTHSDNATGAFVELGQSSSTNSTPVNLPVTATIVLDNVGRGSTGGDLVVGGLSVGDTSTSKGVQVFDITVERSNKLQNINSTNNSLEQVILKNGTAKGDVTVLGNAADLDANVQVTAGAGALPGTEAQHDVYGFNDVRVLDASAMTGKVEVDALLSAKVVDKYMNRTDVQTDINADNSVFKYTLGSNNDTLTLHLDAANLNQAGSAAHGDFELQVAGGAGNDIITTDIINAADGETDGSTWYDNQKLNTAAGAKLVVDGGDGDDTINTIGGGDFVINGGNGNDTIYTDNSGAKASWAFNAANAVNNDLVGKSLGASLLLYKASLTVTVSGADAAGESGVIEDAANAKTLGFESTKPITTTAYVGNQGQVNQAIKDAINNNAVLNKLLGAKDGQDNTVIVTSKVDGQFEAADLQVKIEAVKVETLSAAEKTALKDAYNALYPAAKVAEITQALLDAEVAKFYDATATYDALPQLIVAGTASAAASDNTITGGTGDDVIVLSTGANSGEVIKYSGYAQGTDTIVNFTASTLGGVVNRGADAAGDVFDFSSYGVTSAATVNGVITQVGNVVTVNGQGDTSVGNNEVAIIRFTGNATETFAGLTADRLKLALNTAGDEGKDLYGELDTQALNADKNGNQGEVGTVSTQNHIVMVENAANLGEYKVFHLTSKSNNTDGDFETAELISTVDLGNSLGSVGDGVVVVPPGGGNNGGGNNGAPVAVTNGATLDAATGNVVFTVADENISATIANFSAGDQLDFAAALLADPTGFFVDPVGDNLVTIVAMGVDGTVEIKLTGVTGAADTASSLAELQAVFGNAFLI